MEQQQRTFVTQRSKRTTLIPTRMRVRRCADDPPWAVCFCASSLSGVYTYTLHIFVLYFKSCMVYRCYTSVPGIAGPASISESTKNISTHAQLVCTTTSVDILPATQEPPKTSPLLGHPAQQSVAPEVVSSGTAVVDPFSISRGKSKVPNPHPHHHHHPSSSSSHIRSEKEAGGLTFRNDEERHGSFLQASAH